MPPGRSAVDSGAMTLAAAATPFASFPDRSAPAAHPPRRPLRILVVTESFLPQVNGVTNTVCRILEHLSGTGHQATLVAPTGPSSYAGAPVHTVRSLPLPVYRDFQVGLAGRRTMARLMDLTRPDVVHLASPAVLGAAAAAEARRRDVPTVAVYQTDLVGFAQRYGVPGSRVLLGSWTRRVHAPVDRTLVPSRASRRQLERLGVPGLAWWPRGVDLDRFTPARRSAALRTRLLDGGDVLVGYVGRLAAEKQLHLLRHLDRLPGVRLVLVGTGPAESRLRTLLPHAVFLGQRTGTDLARIVASLDVFVHTGTDETFCQAVQEALASGVPVVAPRSGGPVDLVTPGVDGLLYPPGDGVGLRRTVRSLAGDPSRRRALSIAARRGVLGRSWDVVCDQLLDHYRDVLAERGRAREIHSC